MILPGEWLPRAKMQRVIVHWSAGAYRASMADKEHYHFMIEGDGIPVLGDHEVTDNQAPIALDDYAAHTRGCNTGSIGVALCCMAGATEHPFDPGRFPLTLIQWATLVQVCAQLCEVYSIPAERHTLLSHAEVQATLGKPQRGKWDISRLPFDLSIVGALAVGDKLRAEVKALL